MNGAHMSTENLESIAHALAVYAVTRDRGPLEKTAAGAGFMDTLKSYGNQAVQRIQNDPYTRNTLIGLGAGGLVGLLQPKRKLRDVLTYSMLGGLGGVGLTPLLSALAQNSPAAGAANQAAGETAKSPAQIAAEIQLRDEGLDPATRGRVGQVAGFATAVPAYGAITRGLTRADWRRNGLQRLYDAKGQKWLPRAGAEVSENLSPGVAPGRFNFKRLKNLPSAQSPRTALGRVVAESARKAPVRSGHKVIGGLGAGGVGYIMSLLGQRLGEGVANSLNKQNFPAAFSNNAP